MKKQVRDHNLCSLHRIATYCVAGLCVALLTAATPMSAQTVVTNAVVDLAVAPPTVTLFGFDGGSFGDAPGNVFQGVDGVATPLTIVSWAHDTVVAELASSSPGDYVTVVQPVDDTLAFFTLTVPNENASTLDGLDSADLLQKLEIDTEAELEALLGDIDNVVTDDETVTHAVNADFAAAAALLIDDGTNCAPGEFATGVDEFGNAQGCAAPIVSNGDLSSPSLDELQRQLLALQQTLSQHEAELRGLRSPLAQP